VSELVPKLKMDKLPRALRGAPPRADGTPEGVHLSEIYEFHRCRYLWHTQRRRRIERRRIATAMDLGSACHAGVDGGLRAYIDAGSPARLKSKVQGSIRGLSEVAILQWAKEWKEGRGELRPETEQQLLGVVGDAIQISLRALEFMNLPRWKILYQGGYPMIEYKIWWPIPGSKLLFYGTPDLVAEDREESGTWVHDYKFRERFVSSDDENFDVQLPTYQYGLLQQEPYIPTVGAIKWQFRSELPRQPNRNKNGSMSRQQIVTDWPTYEAALIAAKLDPTEYAEEMRPKLEGVRFMQMDRLYRNTFQVHQTWNEIVLPMTRTFLGAKNFHRVMHTWGCNGCKMKEFCLAELVGEDIDFLLQTSFVDLNSPQALMQLRPEDFDFEEN
jgi:hypothetical protein